MWGARLAGEGCSCPPPPVSPSICVSHGPLPESGLEAAWRPPSPPPTAPREVHGQGGEGRGGPAWARCRACPPHPERADPCGSGRRNSGGTLQPRTARVGSETQGDQVGSSAGPRGQVPGPCPAATVPPTSRAGCRPHTWQGVGLGWLGCDVGSQALRGHPRARRPPGHSDTARQKDSGAPR